MRCVIRGMDLGIVGWDKDWVVFLISLHGLAGPNEPNDITALAPSFIAHQTTDRKPHLLVTHKSFFFLDFSRERARSEHSSPSVIASSLASDS
ncbi:hypothetical protein RSOLAG1IB_09828 [Rhizoctonia solani AG-1 IB]|uniref:Uncharacterized protein n=1 Tax=Thanatephorus cucumeris (strain AG1-IB / isolate 7/3/14) TaxID=1108050 RepID=A0A0B7FU17_THACB|nr:hypothetical protein RSOLAG1IB_09828 [Rhizoctonia solani AG-1 IB]